MKTFIRALALLAGMASIPAPAANPPVPIDLGDLGGDPANPLSSDASAINENGQVVGWSRLPGGGTHAFLWPDKGRMRDLGSPSGQDSYATAINDAGVIVGYADGAHGRQPWVWRNEQFTWLPIPAGTTGQAQSIEPNGMIAGCFMSPANQYPVPVTWDPFSVPQYRMTAITEYHGTAGCVIHIDRALTVPIGGSVLRGGSFYDVACRGWGMCYIEDLEVSGSGKMTGTDGMVPRFWPNLDIAPGIALGPTFCPTDGGTGKAVNVHSEVLAYAGVCKTANGYVFNVEYIWSTEAESISLPPLKLVGMPGCCTHLNALNSSTEVVGQSAISSTTYHATLWQVGWDITVIPLPQCLPHPCHVPPEVWYIPNRFINDGIPSRDGFDARRLDPGKITLGDGEGNQTRVARNADGTLMASLVDLNDDGLLDLQVGFSSTELIHDGVLTPGTLSLELSAVQEDGSLFQARYPVWVRLVE